MSEKRKRNNRRIAIDNELNRWSFLFYYLVASKEAVLFFVFFSGNLESICQVFLSKYHTKTFDWTADLFAFVVKRGRLRQQQAEGQLHDTASAPNSVDCPFHVRC